MASTSRASVENCIARSADRPRDWPRVLGAPIIFHARRYLLTWQRNPFFRSDCSAAPFLVAAITIASCTTAAEHCIAGASLSCACADGSTGAQVCGADGTLGLCSCNATDAARDRDAGLPVSDSGASEAGADAWSGTLNCGGTTCSSDLYVCRQNMCVMSMPDGGGRSCGSYQQGVTYAVTSNTCGFAADTFDLFYLSACPAHYANGHLHASCDHMYEDVLVTYDGIGSFDCDGVTFTCSTVLTADFTLSITCSYGAAGACTLGFE